MTLQVRIETGKVMEPLVSLSDEQQCTQTARDWLGQSDRIGDTCHVRTACRLLAKHAQCASGSIRSQSGVHKELQKHAM
jgi:hypothetical protein